MAITNLKSDDVNLPSIITMAAHYTGTHLTRACASKNGGFTLLEVLVAISIIAISLTTLFSSQSASLSLAIESKFNTTAALLAREVLAEYQSGVHQLIDDEGDFGDDFPGFSWKVEVEEAQLEWLELQPEVTPLYKVDLIISWQDDGYSQRFRWYGREVDEDG